MGLGSLNHSYQCDLQRYWLSFLRCQDSLVVVSAQIPVAPCLPSKWSLFLEYVSLTSRQATLFLIHVPRLLDDLSTYIRDKQTGRPLIFFEMKNNSVAREEKIKSVYKLQWFRVICFLRFSLPPPPRNPWFHGFLILTFTFWHISEWNVL